MYLPLLLMEREQIDGEDLQARKSGNALGQQTRLSSVAAC